MSKIVIIGAGAIGASVAEDYAKAHEVTVIDRNAEILHRLRERLDARFITGSADSPQLLKKAGCADADIILAVTESDLTNLAASRICQSLYDADGVNTRIIRIRNPEIASNQTLLDSFGVTIPYNPEEAIANAIAGAVKHPGVSKMLDCYDFQVRAAFVELNQSNQWVGKTLTDIYARRGELEFHVAFIMRGSRILELDLTKKLAVGDDLLVVARATDLFATVRLLCQEEEPTVRVFIAGGGPIGAKLARKLETDYSVTLVEPDPVRCSVLTQELSSTLVLEADPTDSASLRAEDIEHSHYFCAVTETDEINIMSALLAKQLGCAHAAVLANRTSFQQVLRANGMDMVVSPSAITSKILLREIQGRSYKAIQNLGDSDASLVELKVMKSSQLEGTAINQVVWPENVIPCALIRPVQSPVASDAEVVNETTEEKLPPQLFFPDADEIIAEADTCLVYIRDGNDKTVEKLADQPFLT